MTSNKMVVCKNCNMAIPQKAKVCPTCGVKNKKPFYKRAWFIIFSLLLAFVILITIGGNDSEKLVWSDFELTYLLPEPKSDRGRNISDSDDYLYVYISKTSKEEYDLYVEACEEKGFNIEKDKSENGYVAFNENGYKLSLWYVESDNEFSIAIYAPEELGVLEWGERGLSSLLPVPSSTIGKIECDDTDYFSAMIGNMSLESFADYVKTCEDAGFTVGYSKNEKYFSAENSGGYDVDIEYVGFNIIEISLSAPDKENSTVKEENKEDTTQAGMNDNADGIRSEFKEAMDSYEGFMDEYVEFMKKYINSDGTDLSILSDYATYMSKYAEFVEDFEKWEDEEMNAIETAYYIQVQTRVNEKLLEIAD